MASFKVLQRTDDINKLEKTVKNKWKWQWLELKEEINGDFLSEFVRKIDITGHALCEWCNKKINYAQSGK